MNNYNSFLSETVKNNCNYFSIIFLNDFFVNEVSSSDLLILDQNKSSQIDFFVKDSDLFFTFNKTRTEKFDIFNYFSNHKDFTSVLSEWRNHINLSAFDPFSMAFLSSFLKTNPSAESQRFASSLVYFILRLDRSRYGDDFGLSSSIWVFPGFEMIPSSLDIDPQTSNIIPSKITWNDIMDRTRKPVLHATVVKTHKIAINSRIAILREQSIASVDVFDLATQLLDGSSLVFKEIDSSLSFEKYSTLCDHIDCMRERRQNIQAPFNRLLRSDFDLSDIAIFDLNFFKQKWIESLKNQMGNSVFLETLNQICSHMVFSQRHIEAEIICLEWLLSQDDPLWALSSSRYYRLRPWHALLKAAGLEDQIASGSSWCNLIFDDKSSSNNLVEDLISTFLKPNGTHYLNYAEDILFRFSKLKKPYKTDDTVLPIQQNYMFENHKVSESSIPETIVLEDSIWQAVFASKNSCLPVSGSASKLGFKFAPGSVVICTPGEPAYLRGQGSVILSTGEWCCENSEQENKEKIIVPFAKELSRIEGPIYWNGYRFDKDGSFWRDERPGERFWRSSRQRLALELLLKPENSQIRDKINQCFSKPDNFEDPWYFKDIPGYFKNLPFEVIYRLSDRSIFRPSFSRIIQDQNKSRFLELPSMQKRFAASSSSRQWIYGDWDPILSDRRNFWAQFGVLLFGSFAQTLDKANLNDKSLGVSDFSDFLSTDIFEKLIGLDECSDYQSNFNFDDVIECFEDLESSKCQINSPFQQEVLASTSQFRDRMVKSAEETSDGLIYKGDVSFAAETRLRKDFADLSYLAGTKILYIPDTNLDDVFAKPIIEPWSGLFKPFGGLVMSEFLKKRQYHSAPIYRPQSGEFDFSSFKNQIPDINWKESGRIVRSYFD